MSQKEYTYANDTGILSIEGDNAISVVEAKPEELIAIEGDGLTLEVTGATSGIIQIEKKEIVLIESESGFSNQLIFDHDDYTAFLVMGIGGAGPAGPKGDKGDKGDTGLAGPQGLQGIQGVTGNTGPTGPTGPQGPTGPAGADGANGLDGATGPQGVQGDQGIQGLTGPAGADGADGATGATGPQGPQGLQGLPGADGADGLNGADGVDGADGAIGPTGPTGPQGVQGIQGIQGIAGLDGDPGPAGMNWITGGWLTATSYAVDDALSYNGRSYRCYDAHISAAGDEPGIGATWATRWEILAEKGDTGTTGATGATGDKGDKGDQGVQGIQGLQGVQGDTGPQGPQGIQGIQGVIGDTGATGATGPTGPAGADGADGAELNWIDGGWSGALVPYALLDALSHDGSSYRCILAHNSDPVNEPGTGGAWETYWQILAAQGLQGVPGADGVGTTSPLTTKGDIYVYGTDNDRLPVGTNNDVLTADSTQPLGVKWAAGGGGGGGNMTFHYPWADATTYTRGDVLLDGGHLWLCVNTFTSDFSASGSQPWIAYSPASEEGDSYQMFQWSWISARAHYWGTFNATKYYEAGTIVVYSNQYWLCKSPHSSVVPGTSTYYWLQIGASYGAPYGKETTWIPASMFTPDGTDGCQALTMYQPTATGDSYPQWPVLWFDDTEREYANYLLHLPVRWNRGSYSAVVHWTNGASTSTGDVVWKISTRGFQDNATMSTSTSYGLTGAISTDTGLGTAKLMHVSPATTLSVTGSTGNDSIINLRIWRYATAGTDTFVGDAGFLGIKITWTSDQGDDTP